MYAKNDDTLTMLTTGGAPCLTSTPNLLNNLRKNKDTYWPYMLTSIVCIATYHIMQSIAINRGLLQVSGGAVAVSIFFLGTVVIAIFCVALLFYTNSFLIKRRKKELGLYCVLGLEKRHVALVLFFETLFSALFCLILGLIFWHSVFQSTVSGTALRAGLLHPIAFTISIPSLITTLVLFLLLYAVLFCTTPHMFSEPGPWNCCAAPNRRARTPRILAADTFGADRPWHRLLHCRHRQKEPLNALLVFFGAVLLVIAGTFCLFTPAALPCSNLRAQQNLLLSAPPFHLRIGPDVPDEAKRCRACIHLHPLHHGSCDHLHHGLSLYRPRQHDFFPESHQHQRPGDPSGRPHAGAAEHGD